MTMVRLAAALSVVAACAAGLFLLFNSNDRQERDATLKRPEAVVMPPADRASHAASSPANPARELSAARTTALRVDERASLGKAWSQAPNLRAFALDAYRRPSMGGRLYAEHIARLCSSARYQLDLGQLPYSPHHAAGSKDQLESSLAVRKLQEQCSPFTAEELDSLRMRTTDPPDDPLVKAYRAFAEELGGRPGSRRALIKEVLDSKDPVLLEELGFRLALQARGEQGPSIYFDGQWYPMKADPDIAAAFALLPCEFGYPCGETNIELLAECVLGSPCYASRWQKLEHERCAVDASRCQRIAAWTRRLADAVRAGRDDLFASP